MAWTWQLERAGQSQHSEQSEPVGPADIAGGAGAAAGDQPVPTEIDNPTHPTQSDAESWVGEYWPELAEQGVTQVTLFHDGVFVYGPMLLSE